MSGVDFNDIHVKHGTGAVRSQIANALKAAPRLPAIDPLTEPEPDEGTQEATQKEPEPDIFEDRRVGSYKIESRSMYFLKWSPRADNEIEIALGNFAALIVEERQIDDGLTSETVFSIVGQLRDGTKLPAIQVRASQFAGMGWIVQLWGAKPILASGTAAKDSMRCAIQTMSDNVKRATIYTHCGWRRIGDQWLYLTSGGAIGETGYRSDVFVDLGPGHMGRYILPPPTPKEGLANSARAALAMLDICPQNPAIGAAILALVFRAPLGECYRIDFALFLAGQTGSQKSELAALAMAFFGEFDARSFPANFSDTESDLQHKGHQAKDTVFTIDDFKPLANKSDADRAHAKADGIFRAIGNQSGRGRRNSDLSARPAYHPRGLVVATGEDIPRGASCRARLLILETRRGDVDLSVLSELQRSARSGELRQVMTAFLQWLAPQMDVWKKSLPECVRLVRDGALQWASAHPRSAEVFGSLIVGADLFVNHFLTDIGILNTTEAATAYQRIEDAIRRAVMAQADFQEDQDDASRFIALLRSALTSGRCHIGDAHKQGPPKVRPYSWGWRVDVSEPDDPSAMQPQGNRIGWIKEEANQVWLDDEAALAVVQKFSSDQGEPMTMTKRTLVKRLFESGALAEVETAAGKTRLAVRKVIAGVRRPVVVIRADAIMPSELKKQIEGDV